MIKGRRMAAPEAEWRTLVLDAFAWVQNFLRILQTALSALADFPQSYDLSEEAAAADFRPTIDSLAANVEIVYVRAGDA